MSFAIIFLLFIEKTFAFKFMYTVPETNAKPRYKGHKVII